MPTLTILDQTTFQGDSQPFSLELPSETITIRELIRSRVQSEVQRYNEQQESDFRGLVRPTDSEQTLHGFRLLKKRQIDWEKQFDLAITGFQSNGFLILVDDQQVDELEATITVAPTTEVVFFKLIPLVGG